MTAMGPRRADDPRALLDDALRLGGGASCPPLDDLVRLDLESAGLSEEERQELTAHARSCPACAAERALALEYSSPFATDDRDREAARASIAVAMSAEPDATERETSRQPSGWWLQAAASILAVLAVGVIVVLLSQARAPSLPAPDTDPPMRGAGIEIVDTPADGAQRPLRWTPVDGADHYRVRILGVDDTVVIETESRAPSLTLDADERGRLRPLVSYRWRVEALSATGEVVATSPLTPLRFEP